MLRSKLCGVLLLDARVSRQGRIATRVAWHSACLATARWSSDPQKLISAGMAHALVGVYGDLLMLADGGDCGPAIGTR